MLSLPLLLIILLLPGSLGYYHLECDLCKDSIKVLRAIANSAPSREVVYDAAVKLCTTLKIEKEDVCHGVVHEFENEFFAVLEYEVLSPSDICGLARACPPTNITPAVVISFPTPKPAVRHRPIPSQSTPKKRILQLSDIHFDPHYQPNTNDDCGKPLCCRKEDGPGTAGFFGSPLCDPPRWTLEAMLKQITTEFPDIDYVFWTGDIPPHDIWLESRDTKLSVIYQVTELLSHTFDPLNIPVIPVMGNHEGVPVNSFPVGVSGAWLYSNLSNFWSHWIPSDQMKNFKTFGYFEMKLWNNMYVISINMNACNNGNWWILIDKETSDPGHQLEWLIQRLEFHESHNHSVILAGHIPPGDLDCLETWGDELYSIVDRYENTLVTMVTGHKHTDSFEVFRDISTGKRATLVNFVSPSVTTFQNLNPTFRIFEVDEQTNQLYNVETYFLDIRKANQQNISRFVKEYDFLSEYEMKSVLPDAFLDLSRRIEASPDLMSKYQLFHRNSFSTEKCVDKKCIDSTVCSLQSAAFSQYMSCIGARGWTFQDIVALIENSFC